MNFAWFSATSRLLPASVAALATLATLTTGCGSAASTICDDAGQNCMACDGYGCSAVGGNTLDAAIDGAEDGHGSKRPTSSTTNVNNSSKGSSNSSGSSGSQASKPDAGGDHDAKADAPAPVCGVSGGPCPCTTSATCEAGEVCVAGACEAQSTVCTYSSQCAGGEVCDNGQCLPGCDSTTPCNAGFTCQQSVCVPVQTGAACTMNSQCPSSAPFCVAGYCALACTNSSQCPTGDYCDQGACVLNTAPSPDCSATMPCNAGQVCQDGYCLYTCTSSTQCELIDARIPVCAMNVCRAPNEADPQCTTQAQCPNGESCISNACQ